MLSAEIAVEAKRRWESQHFVVHSARDDASWCEGVLGTLERHFETLQSALGFPWPDGARVEYHKFEDQKALRAARVCSGNNDACFFADKGVFTTEPLEMHELVHAYLAPLGDSHPVLEEGIAEALSCAAQSSSKAPEVTPTEAFDLGAWSDAARGERRALYRAAAWFTAGVFRTHGKERFLALYRGLRRNHSLSEARQIFRDEMGAELDVVWNQTLTSTAPDAACLRAWECAASDATGSLERAWFQRCEQDDHGFTVRLQEPTWLLQQSPGRGVLLGSCGERPTPHAARVNAGLGGNDGELFWLALGPGRYFAQKKAPSTELNLDLRPLERSLGSECSTLEPLPASFRVGFALGFDAAQLSPSPSWVRMRDLDPKRGTGYAVECTGSVVAALCASCDPASCGDACSTRTEPPGIADVVGGELALRVHATASESGTVLVRRTYGRRPTGLGSRRDARSD